MPGLLVVDDTELIRTTIVNTVLKKGLGISSVFEAENGEEAVKLARQHQPDIVFMDIKMPGMNGLQATAIIRKELPNTKIIMLTAYDEFSFAQEAIKLGATDYLLKPLRPNKLIEVLNTVQAKIQEDAKQQRALTDAQQRLAETLPMVEAMLVDDLIYNQSLGEDTVQQNLEQLNKLLAMPVVLVVSIDEFNKLVKRLKPAKLLESYHALTTVIRSAVGSPAKILCGSWQLGQLAIILSTDFQWETIESQKTLGEQIRRNVDSQLHIPVTIGIGGRYTSFSDIAISFAEARTARQYDQGDRRIIHISEMTGATTPHGYTYPLAMEKELLENIRLKQESISLELMNTLVDNLLYNYRNTPQILYSYFAELLTLVSRTIIDMGASAPVVLDQSHRQMTLLFSSPSPAQLRAWALNCVTELLQVTEFEAEKPNRDSVQLAIEYIHKNHQNPELTLGEVAEVVGLSQSHLAFLLKERVGMSYSKYLTSLRIRHAKKLLRTTSMTVSAIADAVGYPNASHFYRIFQRQTDMTPKSYRETKITDQ